MKRFDLDRFGEGKMDECDDGEYIRYEDHGDEVKRVLEDIARTDSSKSRSEHYADIIRERDDAQRGMTREELLTELMARGGTIDRLKAEVASAEESSKYWNRRAGEEFHKQKVLEAEVEQLNQTLIRVESIVGSISQGTGDLKINRDCQTIDQIINDA